MRWIDHSTGHAARVYRPYPCQDLNQKTPEHTLVQQSSRLLVNESLAHRLSGWVVSMSEEERSTMM
jgi:hypothetical protein